MATRMSVWRLVAAVVPCVGGVAALTERGRFGDAPEWVGGKTVYEVNLRQFSKGADVAGFRGELGRLKELGVGVLWFMPVHPIGLEGRSGELGSPYAARDFRGFSSELGTVAEFKEMVEAAHRLGMYVVMDWVANHTALEHPRVKQHPGWYTRDAAGELVHPMPEWKDVADLNFASAEMRREMIATMEYWVREVGVDGFRCDAAELVPLDFWVEARGALWKVKPVLMLAEGVKPELMEYAFDAAYAWDLSPNMEGIVDGSKNPGDLVNYILADGRVVPKGGIRLNFATNHDKNAWEATAGEQLGRGLEAFTVLTFTLPGVPLVYNGQEAGLDKRLNFFARDPIVWRKDAMAGLYRDLAQLRREN